MASDDLALPPIGASASRMMKAIRIHRFGPPKVVTLEEISQPKPGEGEVLIRVEAAGVGPWDAWIRSGKSALPQYPPLTLGSDISGAVVAIGSGVADFRLGDEVYGVTNTRFTGGYAEYAVASAGMIAPKPRSLSHIEAASVPVVAVTAWQMLFEHGRLSFGQTVLVHGSAGNVGAYAVQLARQIGARVIAAATADDAAYVLKLGADEVIDFRSVRFEDVIEPVDAVIDTVGAEVQLKSLSLLRPGGVLVSSVSQLEPKEAQRRDVRAVFFLVDVSTSHLQQIAEMIDAGKLSARVGAVMQLADAREAHEMLDGLLPRPRGKIVLKVDG
jgi:NADPH:quinone reductase-like Zn-dependent oxidoreductase